MYKLDIGRLRDELAGDLCTTERELYGVFGRLDKRRHRIFERDVAKPALHEWLGERIFAAFSRRPNDYQRSVEGIAKDRIKGQIHTLLLYWREDYQRYRCRRTAILSAYQRYVRYHHERTRGFGILRSMPLALLELCVKLLHE